MSCFGFRVPKMWHAQILAFNSAILKAANPIFHSLCNVRTACIDTLIRTYLPKWDCAVGTVLQPALLITIHWERSIRFITNTCQELQLGGGFPDPDSFLCPVEVLWPSSHPQHCPSPCNRGPEVPPGSQHPITQDNIWEMLSGAVLGPPSLFLRL